MALIITYGIFVCLGALSDAFQTAAFYLGIRNNYPVIHVYLFILMVICGAIYHTVLTNSLIKKIVIVLTVAVLCISVFSTIFVEHLFEYPSITNTALSIMVIVFSLLYFYQLLKKQELVHIEGVGFFWINSGMLFSFSLTIFFFMLYGKMTPQQWTQYFIINIITNIIANILFTIGLSCKPHKTT